MSKTAPTGFCASDFRLSEIFSFFGEAKFGEFRPTPSLQIV
jgi:hypothetical protein